MEPREMVNQLNQVARGFQHSQILFTALRNDVFSLLRTAAVPAEIAAARDWPERGARMLLDGLVAIGLVENMGTGAYRNTETAELCLVPGAPHDQRHILEHLSHSYDSFARLDESVRTGGPVKSESEGRTEEELTAFIHGMADLTKTTAPAVVSALDLTRCTHLLDVGAGPAAYSVAFLEAYPNLHATILDMPQVIPIAQERVEKAGLTDRCQFIAGDLTQDPFGDGYDIVFLSNIIHSFDSMQNRAIVKKSFDALEPGGRLIVKDFLLEPGRTGPAFGLVFAINMLLHTPAGDTYTQDEVASWCSEAGFTKGELIALGYASRMWVASKG
ncbi:MAG: methyltransferase [Candidatus Hydrogenedentota bacterium]